MATTRRIIRVVPVLALLIGLLSGCSTTHEPTQAEITACSALADTLSAQDDAFVARVRTIRMQHILMQEYDRQMIAVLNDRRAAIEKTTLTELSVTEEINGCTGQPLDDLRRKAHLEMSNLRSYLSDFNKALKADPPDVFIDSK